MHVHISSIQVNVVISKEGRAALCDFGLSRLHLALDPEGPSSHTSKPPQRYLTGITSSEFNGTLRFCAPELIDGDGQPTFGSDIYAFACTCAEVSCVGVSNYVLLGIERLPSFFRFSLACSH